MYNILDQIWNAVALFGDKIHQVSQRLRSLEPLSTLSLNALHRLIQNFGFFCPLVRRTGLQSTNCDMPVLKGSGVFWRVLERKLASNGLQDTCISFLRTEYENEDYSETDCHEKKITTLDFGT